MGGPPPPPPPPPPPVVLGSVTKTKEVPKRITINSRAAPPKDFKRRTPPKRKVVDAEAVGLGGRFGAGAIAGAGSEPPKTSDPNRDTLLDIAEDVGVEITLDSVLFETVSVTIEGNTMRFTIDYDALRKLGVKDRVVRLTEVLVAGGELLATLKIMKIKYASKARVEQLADHAIIMLLEDYIKMMESNKSFVIRDLKARGDVPARTVNVRNREGKVVGKKTLPAGKNVLGGNAIANKANTKYFLDVYKDIVKRVNSGKKFEYENLPAEIQVKVVETRERVARESAQNKNRADAAYGTIEKILDALEVFIAGIDINKEFTMVKISQAELNKLRAGGKNGVGEVKPSVSQDEYNKLLQAYNELLQKRKALDSEVKKGVSESVSRTKLPPPPPSMFSRGGPSPPPDMDDELSEAVQTEVENLLLAAITNSVFVEEKVAPVNSSSKTSVGIRGTKPTGGVRVPIGVARTGGGATSAAGQASRPARGVGVTRPKGGVPGVVPSKK